MSRHSKNNTAHSIFTYWERKKLKDGGTLKERLGSDSMRQFEQCWLCLNTAVKPICSPDGYIFCRSCIMLNFAEQKEHRDAQAAIWKAHINQATKDEEQRQKVKDTMHVRTFIKTEEQITSIPSKQNGLKRSIKTFENEKTKNALVPIVEAPNKAEARRNCFWIAENTPTGDPTAPPAPKKHLECPVMGKPLRLKDLIRLNPELETQDANPIVAASGKVVKWICPYTKKPLQHQKVVVVKETGQVVLEECVKRFLLGEKKAGGESDNVYQLSDFVSIIPGGTGFSLHNEVEAKRHRPVME